MSGSYQSPSPLYEYPMRCCANKLCQSQMIAEPKHGIVYVFSDCESSLETHLPLGFRWGTEELDSGLRRNDRVDDYKSRRARSHNGTEEEIAPDPPTMTGAPNGGGISASPV